MRRSGEPLTAGARPIRSVPSRPSSTRSSKAAPGEGGKFGRWLLASRLYSLTLGYGTPKSFFAVAPDTWPGDPAIGPAPAHGRASGPRQLGRRGARIGRPAVAARGRPGALARCPERLRLAARPARLRRSGRRPARRPPGRRLVQSRMALVARHLAARRAGRAHRGVDPPLRLAVDGGRSGLRRPPGLLARPPARASQARGAHRPGRPRGGGGAEGAGLCRPGLPARRQALREEPRADAVATGAVREALRHA